MKLPGIASAAAVIATAALVFGASAAQASPNDPSRMTETGTHGATAGGVERTYLVQADGTSVEAPPGTDLKAQKNPYYRWDPTATAGDCRQYEMCFWSGDHYSGVGLFMGGDLFPCDGFRFEGTFMQGRTQSVWNLVAGGTSSIWDRFSDGSYNYNKYGLLPYGYYWAIDFSFIMDAWAFDPANNCTSLRLYQVHNPA